MHTTQTTAPVLSEVSTSIILASAPDQPSNAPVRNALTSETQITVDFEAVAQDNGAEITSYNVEIDDGQGGDFVELQGYTFASMDLTATLGTGIVKGNIYRIKYRALNEVGYGLYSEIAYILAASKPEEPSVIGVLIEGD